MSAIVFSGIAGSSLPSQPAARYVGLRPSLELSHSPGNRMVTSLLALKASFVFLALKALLLLVIARSFVVYEPLRRAWLSLSIFYVVMLGLLSWVFILSMNPNVSQQDWLIWLAMTLALVIAYLKLLDTFEEGLLFWLIFLGGWLGLTWF